MITEETLILVMKEQSESLRKTKSFKREKTFPTNNKLVLVVTGVRRCGKSTLLHQAKKDLKKKIFINFEDPRLEGFETTDFIKLEKIAVANNASVFCYDEIQNITGWEKYIRSAHDKGFQIFITGSNAAMLSRELGTRLTGRYIQSELFPFSYYEYLTFLRKKTGAESFKDFLYKGGFPEFLISEDSDYLRTLLRDIVIRDIVVRRKIRNEHSILRLAIHLMSNVGKEMSYNNLSQILSIKSVRTTIDFCDYLKDSYLFEFIPRFSFSIKQQQINPKKIYCIDTGMARANSISFSEDYGRMFENSVFLFLRKHTADILYYNDGKSECDFLIRKNERVILAVQACWVLNEDNMQRELLGLSNAIKNTKAKKGIIITYNQSDELNGIQVIPAWKWMKQNLEY